MVTLIIVLTFVAISCAILGTKLIFHGIQGPQKSQTKK